MLSNLRVARNYVKNKLFQRIERNLFKNGFLQKMGNYHILHFNLVSTKLL